MLPIRIISVSKTPRGPWLELIETYQKHLKAFARVELIDVKPEPFAGVSDRARVQTAEAERIRKVLPNQAFVIALDEHGKETTSHDFAKLIGQKEDAGVPLCFLIGGPLGLEPRLIKETNATIALSQMTLPHDLAHVTLLEQIYRGYTLLRGKTYHY